MESGSCSLFQVPFRGLSCVETDTPIPFGLFLTDIFAGMCCFSLDNTLWTWHTTSRRSLNNKYCKYLIDARSARLYMFQGHKPLRISLTCHRETISSFDSSVCGYTSMTSYDVYNKRCHYYTILSMLSSELTNQPSYACLHRRWCI